MLISVIITNYNYSKYLSRCIRSCLTQNFEKNFFEVIFVDDNSLDNSVEKAQKFLIYKNFKLVINNSNLGVAKSANKGFKIAKGRFVVRVDADDYLDVNFLKILYETIKIYPKSFGVSCDYFLINKKQKTNIHTSSVLKPIACGILYNKKKFSKYNFYNPKFKHREEEELRLRIGRNYIIKNINLPLYNYVIHSLNKTKSLDYKKIFKTKIHKKKIQVLSLKSRKLLKNIVAIIPARGGSKRLKNKNIIKINGKPMLQWVIDAAKNSSFIKDIYLSSDSSNIINIARKNKIKVFKRGRDLSDDKTPKINVIRDVCRKLKTKPSLIVILQPNSPNMTGYEIDNAIFHLLNNNLSEVMSVDMKNISNGAIRVIKTKMVFYNGLSVYNGFINTDIADIHYKKDIKKLLKRWK